MWTNYIDNASFYKLMQLVYKQRVVEFGKKAMYLLEKYQWSVNLDRKSIGHNALQLHNHVYMFKFVIIYTLLWLHFNVFLSIIRSYIEAIYLHILPRHMMWYYCSPFAALLGAPENRQGR